MDETPAEALPVNSQPLHAMPEPAWKPLTAKQRRVLGTLMEKSNTTPDVYPMSYSGLMTGCNQKSNRAPITQYSVEQVESIVDELRTMGAATIVQGSGRVTKVRHNGYAWLGIQKVEAAIMTELLLRGEQTVGELRTRASRMEPIPELEELKRLMDGLKQRNLIVELTPPGRGQMVSHNLYPEWELEALRKNVAAGVAATCTDEDDESSAVSPASGGKARGHSEFEELRAALQALSDRVQRIESELGL
ncbi:MAG: DUF480 domain-containing protein [Planctomycetota bacterium]